MSHQTFRSWFIDQPIISHFQLFVKMIGANRDWAVYRCLRLNVFCNFDGDMLSYVKLRLSNTGLKSSPRSERTTQCGKPSGKPSDDGVCDPHMTF
jgi:hypothetical protein